PALSPGVSLRKHIGKGTTYFGTQFVLKREVVDAYADLPFRMDGEGEIMLDLGDEVVEEINVKRLVVVSAADRRGTLEAHQDMPDHSVANDAKYWVAVCTRLTPELVAEGVSRELVRHIQNMRRGAGFDVTDQIVTYYQTDEPSLRQVIDDFAGYIKQETLSQGLIDDLPPDGAYCEKHRVSGSQISLAIRQMNTDPS
ncbi:MAG: DUF5915 domain-containing protein, partial [Dehalococcoidia bacterium]